MEMENIDKTLKRKRIWSSQPYSGSGVDFTRGIY
jgi:hypothetical protein